MLPARKSHSGCGVSGRLAAINRAPYYAQGHGDDIMNERYGDSLTDAEEGGHEVKLLSSLSRAENMK